MSKVSGGIKKHKMVTELTIPERILQLRVFLKVPRSSDEIRKEIKDKKGFTIGDKPIKVALLRLLRQEKIKREKNDSGYRYFIE